MEFLSHLPTTVLIALIGALFIALTWAVRIIYKLFVKQIDVWSEKVSSEFKGVKDSIVDTNDHLNKIDKRIDLLFIEIKASDFANDHFLSNGESYIEMKESEKQRLIRDYEFQL